MRDFRDAKVMAMSLRQALTDQSVTLTHSQSLELIAKAFALDNWNILAAKIEAEPREEPAQLEPVTDKKTIYCSFCGKSQHEVRAMIAGPTVFICNGCVELCDSILLDKAVAAEIDAAKVKRPDADLMLVTSDALQSWSDERLRACQASFANWLDHIEWSLRQASAALERKPGEVWQPDPKSSQRGWNRDPLAGKSREEILAQKQGFERERLRVRERAELVTKVLAARPPTPAAT